MHVFLADVGWSESILFVIVVSVFLGVRFRRVLHRR